MKDDTIREVVKENALAYREALSAESPDNKSGETPLYAGMKVWTISFGGGSIAEDKFSFPFYGASECTIVEVDEEAKTVQVTSPTFHNPPWNRLFTEIYLTKEEADEIVENRLEKMKSFWEFLKMDTSMKDCNIDVPNFVDIKI